MNAHCTRVFTKVMAYLDVVVVVVAVCVCIRRLNLLYNNKRRSSSNLLNHNITKHTTDIMYLAALTQHVVICTTVFCLVWFVCVCMFLNLPFFLSPLLRYIKCIRDRKTYTIHYTYIHKEGTHDHIAGSHHISIRSESSTSDVNLCWPVQLERCHCRHRKANDKQTNKFATCSVLSLCVCICRTWDLNVLLPWEICVNMPAQCKWHTKQTNVTHWFGRRLAYLCDLYEDWNNFASLSNTIKRCCCEKN